MFTVRLMEMDDSIVVHCQGRLVRSAAAYQLRNAVQSNNDARKIILDFSELNAIEGGGLGMLAFLRRWTANHGIALKILNPTKNVEGRLRAFGTAADCAFEILRERNVMSLVGLPDRKYWVASDLAA
jgi:anti-anti-sigma regulatory factor